MKEIKITSCEAMPDDEPGQVVVKDREALKKEAERLKNIPLPVLDENGKPTGKFVTNIHTKGPYLVGDADIPDDKFISIHYNPTSFEVNALLQTDLNIKDVYYTSAPRFAAQKADSLMSTPNQPPAPAPTVSTPTATPQTPPAPAPPVVTLEDEDKDTKKIRDELAKEQLRSAMAQLGLTEEGKAELLQLPLKDAYKQVKFLQKNLIKSPPSSPPAPAAPPATGIPPVPTPTNANSTQPAPAFDTGFPFKMLTSLDPDQHPVKGYDPRMLFGPKAEREAALKENRGY